MQHKLFSLAIFGFLISAPVWANAVDPAYVSALEEDCRRIADSQHQCACDAIAIKYGVLKNFDDTTLNRAKNFFTARSKFYKAGTADEKKLEESFDTIAKYQKKKLGCSDDKKIDFAVIETQIGSEYCTRNKDEAQALGIMSCYEAEEQKVRKSLEDAYARLQKGYQSFASLDGQLNRMMICEQPKGPKDPTGVHYVETVQTILDPCVFELNAFFKNNSSILDGSSIAQIVEQAKTSSCFQNATNKKLDLKRITIVSSSNLLANTGEAKEKSFKQLSEERAITVMNQVVPQIFSNEKLVNASIVRNSDGQNGDGTSGSCPYSYNAQKKIVERDYNKVSSDELLQKYKKVEMSFIYNKKGFNENQNSVHGEYFTKCYEMKFSCK